MPDETIIGIIRNRAFLIYCAESNVCLFKNTDIEATNTIAKAVVIGATKALSSNALNEMMNTAYGIVTCIHKSHPGDLLPPTGEAATPTETSTIMKDTTNHLYATSFFLHSILRLSMIVLLQQREQPIYLFLCSPILLEYFFFLFHTSQKVLFVFCREN